MGSGASCCCGGKSTDVIATNTDAKPWMKDEATGPDDCTDGSSMESLTVRSPALPTDHRFSSRVPWLIYFLATIPTFRPAEIKNIIIIVIHFSRFCYADLLSFSYKTLTF